MEEIVERAYLLQSSGKLKAYQGNSYRSDTAEKEEALANMIHAKLWNTKVKFNGNIEAELTAEEERLGLRLAPEQRSAVKTALTNGLCIITGGPGTGKTLIQRAILDIFRRKYPEKNICCCAPTGRAARRLEQSTGHTAYTVHKALGLFGETTNILGKHQSLCRPDTRR